MPNIKFSLIMATLGRSEEICPLLDSLLAQGHKNFELIIVDQNDDDRVLGITEKYKNGISMRHYRSEKKGLSLNRNTGLEYVTGDIVAFPDDDCVYAPDTLEKAARFFSERPDYAFYTCNTRDNHSGGAILGVLKDDADISIYNFMRTGISFTIFVRTPALGAFRFDEQMGVGTPFGSGEESDLLLYLLKNGNRGRYHAEDFVYHPVKAETPEKAFWYGRGFGAVYKKAITVYGFKPLFFIFSLRMIKGLFNIIMRRGKKTRAASFYGRMSGFFQYKNTGKS
jgi:glycosyltransferase involved in cell wall biosynthesis